jgi:hypothetical protein
MAKDMQLNLPQIDPMPRDSFPFQPRKLRKWLKELPLANMGETTRLFYAGLMQANRQRCAPKRRIEIMDLMRPTARIILDNLHRHLLARSLPLPPKTRKISQLQQSLLGELAIGYKHPLHETIQGDGHCDARSLTLAAHRALRYRGEQILMSAQLYTPYPQGIWQDIYAIYHIAERGTLLKRAIKDPESPDTDPSCVRDIFVQNMLLALAGPQSLRQGEAERLAAYLELAAARCPVRDAVPETEGQGIFYLDLSQDEPPEFSHPEDVVISPTNRYLDISPFIDGLRDQSRHRNTDQAGHDTGHRGLGEDLLQRLLRRFAAQPKRQYGRNMGVREVYVAIGLANIHEAIGQDVDNAAETLDTRPGPTDNRLTLVAESAADDGAERCTVASGRFRPALASSVWEMVAKGNVITSKAPIPKPGPGASPPIPQPVWQRWRMLNYSAGGARLCWCESETSHAQVGELLALREQKGKDLHWRVGVIRWMQNRDARGLDVGIQLLATKTLPALIEGHQGTGATAPFRALISPAEDAAKAALFLPPGSFGKGDRLRVKTLDRDTDLELTGTLEHTASFTQYRYRGEGEDLPDSGRGASDPAQQDFDTLWSML